MYYGTFKSIWRILLKCKSSDYLIWNSVRLFFTWVQRLQHLLWVTVRIHHTVGCAVRHLAHMEVSVHTQAGTDSPLRTHKHMQARAPSQVCVNTKWTHKQQEQFSPGATPRESFFHHVNTPPAGYVTAAWTCPSHPPSLSSLCHRGSAFSTGEAAL